MQTGTLKGSVSQRPALTLEDFVKGAFPDTPTGAETAEQIVWHNDEHSALLLSPRIFPLSVLRTTDLHADLELFRCFVMTSGLSWGVNDADGLVSGLQAGGWFFRANPALVEPHLRQMFVATPEEVEHRKRDLADAIADRRHELKMAPIDKKTGLAAWDPNMSMAKPPQVRATEARRPYVGSIGWIERVEGAPSTRPVRDLDKKIEAAHAKRESESEFAKAIAAANREMLKELGLGPKRLLGGKDKGDE